MTVSFDKVFELSCRTDNAYMYETYGEERWSENIHDLVDAGYSDEAIQWIMRSKIARWARDADMNILGYIRARVGDVRLRNWMRESAK
jgi:hypothetical protein